MNKDQVASLAFLAVGAYGLIFAMELSMGTWQQPGARVFPLCVSFLLCLSGVLGFLQATRKRRTGQEDDRIDWRLGARKLYRPIQIVGVTFVYILTMEKLGYLIATWLYLFVLLSWVCRYRLLVAMILSALIGTTGWYFFGKILAVQFPAGILSF